MAGDNVLDRSALEALAKLQTELPHISRSLMDLKQGQKAIVSSVAEVARDVAVVTSQCQRNKEDIDVQRIESSKMSDRLSDVQDSVAGLKSADRFVGGINFVYATIAAIMSAIFGGGSNP